MKIRPALRAFAWRAFKDWQISFTFGELQTRGDAFREQVKGRVSAATLAELYAKRAKLPLTAEYHADFWRRQWQRLTGEPSSVP